MSPGQAPQARAESFCRRFGLRVPILLAPMAGVPAPRLSVAVGNAGGMAACGVLLMEPDEILAWTQSVRSQAHTPIQLNNWIPDPAPERDRDKEAKVREFLGRWGPPVPAEAGDARPPDFEAQCEAMIRAGPAVISSIMGLYTARYVERLKQQGIYWFAAVSTVKEARAAEAAGADAIVAQGSEAGGHRAAFNAPEAARRQVGLFALLPAIVDAVKVPVVATGGIADSRGVAAAFALGASAVQVGTAFLRCPETQISPAWADALARTAPEDTIVTRAFSGRAGRSIATRYALAALDPHAPEPAPYPVQRGLTAAMRAAGQREGDIDRIQAWAGQSAALAKAEPAADVVKHLWEGALGSVD